MIGTDKTQYMRITQSAFLDIVNFIGKKPAESGGALFGFEEDYIIREFIPDTNAKTSRSTYEINTKYLNPIVKDLWDKRQLSLIGIIHSHPSGYSDLSGQDMLYFQDLLSSMKRKKFFAPIVFSIAEGKFEMFAHQLDKDGDYVKTLPIDIISDSKLDGSTLSSKKRKNSYAKRLTHISLNQLMRLQTFLIKTLLMVYLVYLLTQVHPYITSLIIRTLSRWN